MQKWRDQFVSQREKIDFYIVNVWVTLGIILRYTVTTNSCGDKDLNEIICSDKTLYQVVNIQCV